jgi:methyl-accepting chemotaxis protein WspA
VKLTLKRKILGLAFGSAALPVLIMLGLTIEFQGTVADRAKAELNTLAVANMDQIARNMIGLAETANDIVQRRVSRDFETVRGLIKQRGAVQLDSQTVQWSAVDRLTGQPRSVTLPRMLIGGEWLGQNRDSRVRSPALDDVAGSVESRVAIYQRVNEAGDMLCVSSNLLEADGKRAIGFILPAHHSDGAPNTTLQAIPKGISAQVLFAVGGTSYLGAFEPLRDQTGKIVGMLHLGHRFDSLDTVRRAAMAIPVGLTGYVAAVGAGGVERGRYIISRQGLRDGESIWNVKDAQGDYFIQAMIRRCLEAPAGEVLHERYPWRNPGEPVPRMKVASVTYFKPWDWMINVGTYEDEYHAIQRRIDEVTRRLVWRLILAGAVVVGLAMVVGVVLANRAAKPLEEITGAAGLIAAGQVQDAQVRLESLAGKGGRSRLERVLQDETHALVETFRTMAFNLYSLIGQVQRSGIQVTTSATEIAAAARQLEATVAEQAASAQQVSAASKQVAVTSKDLSKAMLFVNSNLTDTSNVAEAGRHNLDKMELAMRQLLQASTSISTRLETINQRAATISSVVVAIQKVSDQTNLLSLNAAIEAEKAGEYGKGFSVVAREVRRLADQTAVAAHNIGQVVREMQSSVAGGVMEMDKFSEEVNRGVEVVAGIGKQMAAVIDQVRALTPQFEVVKETMDGQLESADQINEAMGQLSLAVDQTRESLTEFRQVTQQLNEAVLGLQSEVSRFRAAK